MVLHQSHILLEKDWRITLVPGRRNRGAPHFVSSTLSHKHHDALQHDLRLAFNGVCMAGGYHVPCGPSSLRRGVGPFAAVQGTRFDSVDFHLDRSANNTMGI